MAVTGVLIRHCSTCGEERQFEQPPCLDGHGDDCPEWACVECGEALIIGTPLIDTWIFDDLPIDVEAPDEPRQAPGSPSQAA